MPLKSFIIPVLHAEWAEQELNRFLQTHKVLSVERQFVDRGENSFWAVLVDYLAGPASQSAATSSAGNSASNSATGKSGSKKKIDYKERLDEQDFEMYLRLRGLRKEMAAAEGLALYNVYTNEQLAQIAEQRPLTKEALLKIPGIGEARADKYSPRTFALLKQFPRNGDEESGQAAGTDR